MKELTSGSEAKLIFKFALPLVAGNLLHQLYNIIDSIIVGRFLGTEALAAVGASFPIFYTLIAFIIGIGSGATVIISQYFGARQMEKVKEAIGTIYIFMFIAGIFLTIVGISFSKEIFGVLGVADEVMPLAIAYFNVYMVGMVSFFGFNGTTSVLRGLGDSSTPLKFLIISNIANILLDLLFVVVLNWGIASVAWSTVIAQTGAFIGIMIYLNKREHLIHLSVKRLSFDKVSFWQSVRVGLPTGFQQTFVAMGMMALVKIINNFDTTTLAAFTVASKIDSLAAMPALHLASALSAFVGQNQGAGEIERIRRGVWAAQKMALILSLTLMVVVLLFGNKLIALFDNNPEVIRQGSEYLVIVCSFYVVFASMFVFHGALRGAGDTLVPMFITLVSLWLVRIPAAWFLSSHFGESGIWWSIPLGWSVGLAGTWIYYKSGRWKKKSVVRHEIPPE